MPRSRATAAAAIAATVAAAVWTNAKWAFAAYCGRTPEEQALEPFEAPVVVNGVRLNRLLKLHPARPDGVCFVLVHGFGGQIPQWAPLIPQLSAAGSVFALDMVGHGRSQATTNPADYDNDAVLDSVVAAFTAECPRTRRIVLVGHSLGTSRCAQLLARFRAKHIEVAALVLLAPLSEPHAIDRPKSSLAAASVTAINIFRFVDTFNGPYSASVARMYHTADLDTRLRQLRWNQATPTHVVRLAMLGIFGEFDVVTNPVPNATNLQEWIRKAPLQFVCVSAGHALMWEARDEVLRHLDSFLATHKIIAA
nr:hypothetical protein HK105_004765 [Polyrhizophydium stewartii]